MAGRVKALLTPFQTFIDTIGPTNAAGLASVTLQIGRDMTDELHLRHLKKSWSPKIMREVQREIEHLALPKLRVTLRLVVQTCGNSSNHDYVLCVNIGFARIVESLEAGSHTLQEAQNRLLGLPRGWLGTCHCLSDLSRVLARWRADAG